MIPKILHQIWVGPYRIPKRELASRKALVAAHPDWECHLWQDADVALLQMPPNTREAYDFWGVRKDYVAQADILRIFLVREFGGVYMDIDFDPLRGFEGIDLSDADSFFCWHDTDKMVETIPNGVFGGAKDSKIITSIENQIIVGTFNMPTRFGQMILSYFGITEKIPHLGDDGILKYFEREKSYMMTWADFSNKHFRHNALYSHSGVNKAKFERGEYE